MLTANSIRPILAMAAILFVPALYAQDFFNGGVGARTAAQGGIYVPQNAGALDSLSMNPAGLAALAGPVADLGLTGILARGSFSNRTNSDSSMRFNAGATPLGAFATPLGHSAWTLAAGFLPDLLSSSKWQFRDAPGVAGADYGPQHEKSAILAFRFPVGVSYRVTSSFSLGATVSAIYNSNTLVMPYVFQSHPALSGLKTLLNLHTTGVGWNSSFGMVVKPLRRIELAASYRTKSSITSTGNASGNLGAQFSALSIPFSPTFAYRAQVQVELPQSAFISASWQASKPLRLSLQSSWTSWRSSFHDLPVSLSEGSNSSINSLLHSSSLNDTVPLNWKDQFSIRAGGEYALTEQISVAGGFAHSNDAVPSSTLSPLTAAIMKDALSTGLGYGVGRSRFDVAYQVNLNNTQSVATSSLLAGEFSNSRVKVGTQALTVSTSFHF